MFNYCAFGGSKTHQQNDSKFPPLLLEFFAVNLSRKNNKIVSFYLSTVEMNLLFVVSLYVDFSLVDKASGEKRVPFSFKF
jgi:hypothetical protein